MTHNRNWFVRCTNCEIEIGYGTPVTMDESGNVFCDIECFHEYHHGNLVLLNDDLGIPDYQWNKFDDEY